MSRDSYFEINLHITWHTKNSSPTLTPAVEKVAHDSIRERVWQTSGVILHELGGTENHVHLAVSVPPTLMICEFIGLLKGGSSRAINQMFPKMEELFAWQVGYGVVTFGTRELPWVIHYIRNQKEHHSKASTHLRLERIAPVTP